MFGKRVQRAVTTSVLVVVTGLSIGASMDTPGATVEVREGDLWSKATVVRKEGRKTFIRYDDNSEEWVTAERLRGISGVPGLASTTRPAAAAQSWLTVGNRVERKDISGWRPGRITDSQRGWYLVKLDHLPWSYWCEPWLLRAPGSDYDIELSIQDYHRRQILKEDEPAPADSPGPSRGRIGKAPQSAIGAPAPPVMRIDLGAAAGPQPGTMTPLKLATTRPTRGFQSAEIRTNDRMHWAHSVAVCRDTPGIVVFGYGWDASRAVEVIRFDTTTGRTIGRCTLSRKEQRVLGAAKGGTVLLTVDGNYPDNLRLWELRGNGCAMTAEYDLGIDGRGRQITFACLTDATHAVVRDSAGMCFYIDLKENRATGEIRTAADARVYVDPTGQILTAITTGGKAVLIRLSDFSTIAAFPGAAAKGNVAIDPAGELIAFFSADGPVRVIRLADGSLVANIHVAWQVPGELDLREGGFLLVDHRYVYDVQTGIPVWIYNPPTVFRQELPQQQYQEQAFVSDRALGGPLSRLIIQLANGQTLFCSSGQDISDVVMATLPEAQARNALKGVGKESFMLTPGTPVSLDIPYSRDEETGKIADAVRKAIKAAGLVLSAKQEAFHVTLSIEPGNTQQRDYNKRTEQGPVLRLYPQGMQSAEAATVSVPSTVVTIEMTHKNKPVWSWQFTFAARDGDAIPITPGQTPQEAVNEAARPKVEGMRLLTIPAYLPRGSKPGTVLALGASDVTPQGIVPMARVDP